MPDSDQVPTNTFSAALRFHADRIGSLSELARRLGMPLRTAQHYAAGTRAAEPWVQSLVIDRLKREPGKARKLSGPITKRPNVDLPPGGQWVA